MPNEPDKPGKHAQHDAEEPADDAEGDRPTVTPPFDPVEFAREALGPASSRKPPPKPTPAAGGKPPPLPPARPPPKMAGKTPAPLPKPSLPKKPSSPRAPRMPAPTLNDPAEMEAARRRSIGSNPVPARPTPSPLSLANSRIPSTPPKKESAAFAPVDREWDDIATRPPPPLEQSLIDSLVMNDRNIELSQSELAGPVSQEAPATEQEMNDRVSLGDYTGALDVAEKLLAGNPNHAAAKECAESCRGVLKQMYTARIGPLDRVPLVMVPRDQLRWLSIDHRAGFVLSLIDGVSSLEMILDVSGMPELDALRILSELAQQRIISFR